MALPRPRLQCVSVGCDFSTFSASAYSSHIQVHRLDRNFRIRCPLCAFCSKSSRGLQTHIAREHSVRSEAPVAIAAPPPLLTAKCSVPACEAQLTSVGDLKKHLFNHIGDGETIVCPFGDCPSTTKANRVTSFDSVRKLQQHMSRWHKVVAMPMSGPAQLLSADGPSTSTPILCEEDFIEEPCVEESGGEADVWLDSDLESNVARFYLKLEGHHLLPEDVIQTICQDITALLDMSRKIVEKKLVVAMVDAGLSREVAVQVAHTNLTSDPLYKVHHKQTGALALTSKHLRKQYYANYFGYRKPEKIELYNKDGKAALTLQRKEKTIQTVPIRLTLERMLEDPSVQKYVDLSFENLPAQTDPKIYRDFTDGEIFLSHQASKQKSLRLLMFQDGFAVTNPIGAAKNKYKSVGCYLTLGNLPAAKRSKVNTIKLVGLIPEAYLKSSDPKEKYDKHVMCWRPIIDQLKELEKNGILYKGEVLPVYLIFMLGDNLGSHQIGGFTESFGIEHWCRYCEISSTEFRQTPHLVKNLRTPEDYEKCANEARTQNVTQVKGVKFISLLNECKDFNVCGPRLPPCIAHDMFEGVVAFDLVLIIKDLINKKWFTCEELNSSITRFKIVGMDSGDKPSHIEKDKNKQIKGKLSGNAVQNWNMLRHFSLLLGPTHIKNVEDHVWKLYLSLKHICELVFAPTISYPDVLALELSISTYLNERLHLFPNTLLRPKHHFMMHYPRLILLFGPLIRLFTLRMESKHPLFRKAAIRSQNFIDVYYTMANKHQVREAYQCTGPLLTDEVSYTTCTQPIFEEEVSIYVSQLVLPPHTFTVETVILNGIQYKRTKTWLAMRQEEGCLVIGQVTAIFCVSFTEILLVLKLFSTSIKPNDYGLHEISLSDERGVSHVADVNDLDSFYPLSAYMFGEKTCLTLKYWPASKMPDDRF